MIDVLEDERKRIISDLVQSIIRLQDLKAATEVEIDKLPNEEANLNKIFILKKQILAYEKALLNLSKEVMVLLSLCEDKIEPEVKNCKQTETNQAIRDNLFNSLLTI